MLLFCAAYVFGCAFRSFLPRADVQRICLFDTWWSSVLVGRTVATVAEIAFVAQWAILLHQLGTMTGAETTVNAAWVIVPLILIAECLSWYAVLTRNYLGNAIENSLWAVAFFIIGVGLCRLLPEFHGAVRVLLAIAIAGIAGFLAFLMTIDVPMYLKRWRTGEADGDKRLTPREGLRDVSTRWVVTHDLAEWKDEIAWMSLYFSLAVWSASRCASSIRSKIICRSTGPGRRSSAYRLRRRRSWCERRRAGREHFRGRCVEEERGAVNSSPAWALVSRGRALDKFQIGVHVLTLAAAFVLAVPIGWDREKRARSAGLRTFPLVAMASCGFVQASEQLMVNSPDGMAKVIEGVITGIGFIGGGAILKQGTTVQGTATAASLWATGAIGVSVGLGSYDVAVTVAVFTFLTLRLLTLVKEETTSRTKANPERAQQRYVVVRLTAATALPIVVTPGLIGGLFLLTVVMCIGSSIAAIVQVTGP